MKHFDLCDALQLRDAFAPCPVCGMLVCVRLWQHETGWNELPQPQSCLLGEIHACRTEGRQGSL